MKRGERVTVEKWKGKKKDSYHHPPKPKYEHTCKEEKPTNTLTPRTLSLLSSGNRYPKTEREGINIAAAPSSPPTEKVVARKCGICQISPKKISHKERRGKMCFSIEIMLPVGGIVYPPSRTWKTYVPDRDFGSSTFGLSSSSSLVHRKKNTAGKEEDGEPR